MRLIKVLNSTYSIEDFDRSHYVIRDYPKRINDSGTIWPKLTVEAYIADDSWHLIGSESNLERVRRMCEI